MKFTTRAPLFVFFVFAPALFFYSVQAENAASVITAKPADTKIYYEKIAEPQTQNSKEENLPDVSDEVGAPPASYEACALETEKPVGRQRYQRVLPPKAPLAFDLGNLTGKIQIKWKPETFFAKNSNLLNDNNTSDWLFLNRSTIDINFDFLYGRKVLGYDSTEFFVTLRNKNLWGDAESIAATTDADIKLLEVVFGPHRHFISRNMVWIREIWLKFCINDALAFGFNHNHFFTLGSFPFELGRGIALGAAFAVSQRFLGFFSDTTIDQYAYGFKLSGDFFPSKLTYDVYGAILENKSGSFSNTSLKNRGQHFGHRLDQERGPGKINFVVAGRLRWTPVRQPCGFLQFEPYIMYNRAPEQLVEIPADSRGQLGTIGLASEFTNGNWEGGFDFAKNFGVQDVFGIDRNRIDFENRFIPNPALPTAPNATVVVVNSRVVTQDPNVVAKPAKAFYDTSSVEGKQAQQIINTSAEDASQNGQRIGTLPSGVELFNDLNRFRNPHRNIFEGWMIVADVAYWMKNRTVRVAGTFGYATGDEDPNQNLDDPNGSLVDGNFKGFIGLQELYSGNRVQSAFFLGGAGRIPRPLTVPNPEEGLAELPSLVSGFTNLMFVGGSVNWFPKTKRTVGVRPNILTYWQTFHTKKFDVATGQSSPTDFARNFLGTEINTFIDVELIKDLKGFLVGSVFFPGAHYKDIKGTPLSKDQLKILDNVDVTGITDDKLPLLGVDTAFTLNVGLEYRY
ncbi:hypothetical protein HYX58_06090 [Candidatus Dependentiae bacterium]|nr:hypothetical protein [Candidatus Dependentiae bacterium]